MMASAIGRQKASLSTRFVAKLVIDVLPAAAASLIGSFVISQYQFHHVEVAPPAERAAAASPEMMQLVRDEHTAIISYLKAEMAAQQHRHAAEDEAQARAVAESKAPPAAPVRAAAAAPVSTPVSTMVSARTAVMVATPPRQPLELVRADQNAAAAAPVEQPPQQKSLLATTLDVKDQFVDTTLHATWHAVSAIGGIPSWIASFGSRIGGSNADAEAGAARLRAS
jgi:hypothetical protein